MHIKTPEVMTSYNIKNRNSLMQMGKNNAKRNIIFILIISDEEIYEKIILKN